MIKYVCPNELRQATIGSSGFDLIAWNESDRTLDPGVRWLVPTGLHLEMPLGVEAQVRSRSGLAINYGVVVLNAPGTIDSDYRGEVMVSLINLGQQPYVIRRGERIAQIVFAPVYGRGPNLDTADLLLACTTVYGLELSRVESVRDLSHTDRGVGGHGSTGL